MTLFRSFPKSFFPFFIHANEGSRKTFSLWPQPGQLESIVYLCLSYKYINHPHEIVSSWPSLYFHVLAHRKNDICTCSTITRSLYETFTCDWGDVKGERESRTKATKTCGGWEKLQTQGGKCFVKIYIPNSSRNNISYTKSNTIN